MRSSQQRSALILFVGLAFVIAALWILYWSPADDGQLALTADHFAIPVIAGDMVPPLPRLDVLVAQAPDQSAPNIVNFVYPTHIAIESAGIDAPVSVVGLDERRYVETPPDRAGFWDASAALDAEGNTVIVGHNKSTPVPVFRDLGNVQNGNEIVVTGHTGREYRFVINDIEIVQVEGAPEESVRRVAELMSDQTRSNVLTVVACFPAESCERRIVVRAFAASN